MYQRFLLLFLTLTIGMQAYAQCITGDCREGYGTMVTEDGNKYVGHFEKYLSTGQGVCFFKNGDKYVGTWKEGFFNGEGRLYYADGTVKGGVWEKGVFQKSLQPGCISGDCSEGYGIFLYDNGVKYAGQFKDGIAIGQGSHFYTDGSKYIGNVKNGMKDGYGVMYFSDGTKDEGLWSQGKSMGAAKGSKGCLYGDCNEGFGTYVYSDNTRYEGEFSDSLAHGKGSCYYSDGDQYHGEWKYHTFDGNGTMYLSDGTILKGIWRAGDYIGEPVENKKSVSETPKVWALLVGVARYNHMKSLKFTDDDAYRMYGFLKSPEGGALRDDQITILIDEDATKDNILSNMESVFDNAGPNDIVLFYFSGHGLKGSFLPSDYDGNDNKLYHHEITSILENCEAKGKVIIADACHSGSFKEEMYTMKSGVNNIIESYYDAFSASKGGTALMLSSKAEETSIENNGLRQGIFSHFLIRGLKGAADYDGDKIVSIEELFNYIEANVKYYTNNYQTPIITGDYDGRMPLGVVR